MGETQNTGRHVYRETHIASDMCLGEHISRGNTYHCDTDTVTLNELTHKFSDLNSFNWKNAGEKFIGESGLVFKYINITF